MTKRRGRGRRSFKLALIALFIAGGVAIYQRYSNLLIPRPQMPGEVITEGRLAIYALDVGQGDSFLIITPERKSVLIDAGTSQSGDEIVSALAQRGVQGLDLAIATHPHADHIGAMKRVLDRFSVKNFLDSGQSHTSATYERMLKALKDEDIRFIIARRGQTFDLDSDIKLEVLSPSEPLIDDVRSGGSVLNANSVIVRLSYGDFAMIFAGDAESETESQLIRQGTNLRAQILKIGHHGSRYATSSHFLEAIAPQVAIISCGAENKYGHPSQQVLDRLREKNVQIYRTDIQGVITITSDGKDFYIHPTRQADIIALGQGRQQTQGE